MGLNNNIILRSAAEDDVDEMLDVFLSAFHDSILNPVCFPTSDPMTLKSHRSHITKNLSELLIAEDASAAAGPSGKRPILGWVHWVRKPTPQLRAPTTMTNDMFPPTGDQDFARRYYQCNADASARIMHGRPHWHLSIIVVRRDAQRRGVGANMLRHGLDKADEEGWLVYLNSSVGGRPMYEAFEFRTIEATHFDHGLVSWHMLRKPKGIRN